MKSKPHDDGAGPPDYVIEKMREIRAERKARKRQYDPLIRRGCLEDRKVATYCFGPVNLPLDFFTSSRWHERRTCVPLPLDEAGWRFCWDFWKGAASYRAIRDNCEKHGMRRPLLAEWYVNYDPAENRLAHRAFAFRGSNPDWPFLVLRTGNERLMMAWFEWGWKDVPVILMVRDCGHSAAVTALLRWIADMAQLTGWAGSREILRLVGQTSGEARREEEAAVAPPALETKRRRVRPNRRRRAETQGKQRRRRRR